jgi:tRNA threonylcarbamoyladenosine biosynthesis protein TsaB
MRILALDAATEACSAALLDGTALTERFEVIGRGHANRLLPMVDALLREAGRPLREIDAIAFGRGPGGFTGLRIAAGIAQGLAAGAGKPVLPVSNLAAIAAGAARTHGPALVVACLDARMNQVYWAAFDTGAMPPRPLTPESLADPDAVELPGDSRYYGAGHGFAAYPALVARLGDRLVGVDGQALPRAGDIARIGAAQLEAGEGVPAARGLPVYLRDDVVHRR